jgi:hypothetical protein
LGIFSLAAISSLAQGILVVPNKLADSPGNFEGGTRTVQQQVYAASQFVAPGIKPITITGLALRLDEKYLDSSPSVFPRIQLWLSTSPRPITQMSQLPSINAGPDRTLVYSHDLVALGGRTADGNLVAPFDLMLKFDAPYVYHWEQGNLVLDMNVRQPLGGFGPLLDMESFDPANPLMRIVAGSFGSVRVLDLGYVTQFLYDVPEPAPIGLTLFGLLAIRIGKQWKKRRWQVKNWPT